MTIDVWGVVAAVLMSVAVLVSVVPFVPGPALVWAIGMVYAAATGLVEVGMWTVVGMTALMLLGSTADWWTRLFGLSSEGSLSCGTLIVSGVGAIAGTFFIPIPLVGTLLGAMLAVGVLVWLQEDDAQKALTAARGILSAWLASFFVEFVVSVAIVALFVRALLS